MKHDGDNAAAAEPVAFVSAVFSVTPPFFPDVLLYNKMRFSPLHILPLCLIAASVYLSEPAFDEGCSNLEVVIARGTDEPLNPSFGAIVGDPLFADLRKLIPTTIGYATNYPASFDCNSEQIGASDTVAHLQQKAAQCPGMKFALVGYSQGADVIHKAVATLPTSIYPAIIALVMFGDPGNKGANVPDLSGGTIPAFPAALANKLKENCAEGDPVCSEGANPDAHLSYDNPNTTYIADSATYIATQFSSNGMVGPELSNNGGDQGATPQISSANSAALAMIGSLLGRLSGATSACPPSSSAVPPPVAPAPTTTNAANPPTSGSIVQGSPPVPASVSATTPPKSSTPPATAPLPASSPAPSIAPSPVPSVAPSIAPSVAPSVASSIAPSAPLSGVSSAGGITLPTSNAPPSGTTTLNSLASLTVTTPVITFTGAAAPRMKILW